MGTTRRKLIIGAGIGAAAATVALAIAPLRRRLLHPLVVRTGREWTIQERLDQLTRAKGVILDACRRAGFSPLPARVTLLGLKDERRLEVYGTGTDGSSRLIASYPILAASGVLGPKLREGDRQVPEGVYPLELLNPNSRFHVSLRVGYPNEFDRRVAAQDGRTNLGGDIMIHGGAASIGCLAMGDPAAEELFVLAANVGIENVTIVLSPLDLRSRPLPAGLDAGWRRELYDAVEARLAMLPA
jgi:hypothetical protein